MFSVMVAVLIIPFIHVALKGEDTSAVRDDDGAAWNNGTYGMVPSVTMYPVDGGKVFIESNRTNIIHFMYLEHLGGIDVVIQDENRDEFGILQQVYERYPVENLSIFTIMIPSCCLPPYDTFLHLVYDRDRVKWDVIIDDDYELYMTFEDYLRTNWDFLSEDPTLMVIDGQGSIVSVTGFLELDPAVVMLDDLVYGEGNGSAGTLPPQADLAREATSLLGVYGAMIGIGFLSNLAPCCIALLLAALTTLKLVQDRTGSGEGGGEGEGEGEGGAETIRMGIGNVREGTDNSPNEIDRRAALRTNPRRNAITGIHVWDYLSGGEAMTSLSFCLGMGIFFFIVGIFASFLSFLGMGNTHYAVMGISMIVLGIYTLFKHGSLGSLWQKRRGHVEGDACSGGICSTGCCSSGHAHGRTHRSIDARARGLAIHPALLALLVGVFYGILGAPCSVAFLIPAILILLSLKPPLLVGGALMFAFGVSRGSVVVPVLAGVKRLGRVENRYLQKIWKVGIAVFSCVLVLIGLYYLVILLL